MSILQNIKQDSDRIEAKLLQTVLRPGKLKQTVALIDKETFLYNRSKKLFARISTYILENNGELPTLHELYTDLTLSQPEKMYLKNVVKKAKPYEKEGKLKVALKKISQYKKVMSLKEFVIDFSEKMKEDTLEVDDILDDAQNTFSDIVEVAYQSKDEILHMGKKSNYRSVVKDVLSNEKIIDDIIPTGFDNFDKRNGGIGRGSLFVLGSIPGGGKSVVANNILTNGAKKGFNGIICSLEMGRKEITKRNMANFGEVNHTNINLGKCTSEEKAKIIKGMDKFNKILKENGALYTVFAPENDINIDQFLRWVSSAEDKYDVVVLDYLNLLDGTDGQDQARVLSSIARKCKRFAQSKQLVFILIVQIDDKDQRIRYAKAIKEHADVFWSWVYTETDREAKLITVNQKKGRNQELATFTLEEQFEYCRVVDSKEIEYDDIDNEKPKKSKKNKHKWVDDEDDEFIVEKKKKRR